MDIHHPKTLGKDLNFSISFDNKEYNINIKFIDLEVDLKG